MTFLILAAVVGIGVTNHGLDSQSTPLVTTVIGFGAPTVAGLLLLLQTAKANGQRERQSNTLDSIHEAVQSQGSQLDGLVATVNDHTDQITAIQGAVGATKRAEDPANGPAAQ